MLQEAAQSLLQVFHGIALLPNAAAGNLADVKGHLPGIVADEVKDEVRLACIGLPHTDWTPLIQNARHKCTCIHGSCRHQHMHLNASAEVHPSVWPPTWRATAKFWAFGSRQPLAVLLRCPQDFALRHLTHPKPILWLHLVYTWARTKLDYRWTILVAGYLWSLPLPAETQLSGWTA
jgi:hypothetical protein